MSGPKFLSFVAVLICTWNVDALSSEDKSAIKTALHPFVMQCAKEFGVTDEQFAEAKKKGSHGDINPCFMSCFLKKSEIFDSHGMFDVEKATSFAKSNLKSDEAIKMFLKVGDDCAKVNDEEVSDGEEGCDRAKLLSECLMKHKDNQFE